jgi:hypothetical protein
METVLIVVIAGAAFNVRNLGPILPLSLALFLTRLVAIWLGSWAALGCVHGGAAPDLTSKSVIFHFFRRFQGIF